MIPAGKSPFKTEWNQMSQPSSITNVCDGYTTYSEGNVNMLLIWIEVKQPQCISNRYLDKSKNRLTLAENFTSLFFL